jgi:hypothetical protein
MGGGAGASLAGMGFMGSGGEEPGDVLRLLKRDVADHDAQQEVGEGFSVLRDQLAQGAVPEGFGCGGEVVALKDVGLAVAKLEQLELVIVGDEAEAVGHKVAANLGGVREGTEVGTRRLDLDCAALRRLAGERLALGAAGEWEEAAIGKPGTVGTGMGLEVNTRLEALADGVEQVGERGVEGGFCNVRAKRVRGAHGGEVLLEGIGGSGRQAMTIPRVCGAEQCWNGYARQGVFAPARAKQRLQL